jgi:flagellar basal-body rod protein FlgB
MQSIQLFGLISQHNDWLATRQSLVAGNVANINTPGYKSRDLEPFESAMQAARMRLAVTKPGHMAPETTAATAAKNAEADETWEVYHSGSSVNVEQEMLKASQVSGAYSLNTNIVKAFHRMLLSSARPGGS